MSQVMKIDLNLKKHCIETETKRLYDQSVLRYFNPGSDRTGLEKQIEILEHALKTLDFQRLRSTYPELSGDYDGEASYAVDERSQAAILINGKPVELF